MPRRQTRWVTFSIDGREVSAPENAMLVDGAKYGDVEIPAFCHEPKFRPPVGACRMCLVEIEGIPALQTACQTPVKDGMAVHSQTERVHGAERAVVEFLLINTRSTVPSATKAASAPCRTTRSPTARHARASSSPSATTSKPLSPSRRSWRSTASAAIMCCRCVRFSQEISEDYHS